jgi:hypothetical protein
MAGCANTVSDNRKKSKKMQKASLTEEWRKHIVESGVRLTILAKEAKIGYHRLRRILVYDYDPTLDEAHRIEQAVKTLVSRERDRLEGLSKHHLALS